MLERRRVALALGSGGARGYAHIGVVRELESRGFEVVTIAGTSMGALVGGLAAAGRLDDYAAWAQTLRQRDVLRLLDPAWSAPGAFAANRLWAKMAEFFDGQNIEDLRMPFTAVATDLGARREVWFQRGPLAPAVRASIAIPGLFTPVMIDGRLLVDGGLTNPVPVDPTSATPADLVIAVSVFGARLHERSAPAHVSAAAERGEAWRERLRRTVAAVSRRDDETTDPIEPEPVVTDELTRGMEQLPAGLKLRDVTAMSFEAMQNVVARYRMAALPPDVVIDIPVDACGTLDFHRAGQMIELGHELTAAALARRSGSAADLG